MNEVSSHLPFASKTAQGTIQSPFLQCSGECHREKWEMAMCNRLADYWCVVRAADGRDFFQCGDQRMQRWGCLERGIGSACRAADKIFGC